MAKHNWTDKKYNTPEYVAAQKLGKSKKAAVDMQVPCGKCHHYATKREIMTGEAEYQRQKDGTWLCSMCSQQAEEWANA